MSLLKIITGKQPSASELQRKAECAVGYRDVKRILRQTGGRFSTPATRDITAALKNRINSPVFSMKPRVIDKSQIAIAEFMQRQM